MSEDWKAVAEELAAELRADAVERERGGAEPASEVDRLRKSGLLRLLVPSERGGGGAGWSAVNEATRIVAAADASVGHLLGYHYLQLWRTGLFARPDEVERLQRATTTENWFWAGVSNPLDAALRLTAVPGGLRVDGTKTFATGTSVADRLVVSGVRTDTDAKVTFTIDARAAGISHPGGWDNLGQRLTASGAIAFDGAFVPDAEILGNSDDDTAGAVLRSLASLGFQLMLAQVAVGIAEGALAEAADYTRTRGRGWAPAGISAAVEDPYALAGYGEWVARTKAARALADEAAAALWSAFEAGEELGAEQRGEAAVTIASAKVVSSRLATEIASGVFEFTGARSTSNSVGLDRFWRNARTLTLHDPMSHKASEVGEHFLTGAHPIPSGYS
ncbi:acyl-CoA dehydrogenase family protein [Saccharopolyspora mangrovi]|uniref:Acyl-CoA dehydrogenase family protein n=1 Tax=Saccharopolyspora mangrovi TaxID=3082379 RepID=A0ABU6AHB1_9PSEU|nr:acyl-CoA dehydrogenase family protein [Saccharopolyspora sp. S2-29]MEB3370954.1 acyl-CoA dehydrogenase family protein [Saccharopolyspora sp. S2-29]